MYFVPQTHKCPKCSFEMEYSQSHHPYNTPVTDKGPICPKCYGQWLTNTFPVMEWVK